MNQLTPRWRRSDLESARRLRVVLYTHVNGQDSERLRYLSVQLETLRRYAHRDGWTIVGEFADGEFGGAADRSGLSRVLIDARDGRYDILLVYSLDRLARSVRDTDYLFDELDRAGILILSVTDVVDITSHGHRTWLLVNSAPTAPQVNQGSGATGAPTPRSWRKR